MLTSVAAAVAAVFAALAPPSPLHHGHHHHRPAAHHHHRQHHHRRPATVRLYARQLTLHRWHSIGEWRALDAVVTPESGWDPCAVYPSHHDCFYRGVNSCGIPQRDPCPYAWRGRLYVTRWVQVRALIAYVSGRYGDPYGALAFRRVHGWY